ncbi:MAG: DegV family protein [Thomasclavelia ramosa]
MKNYLIVTDTTSAMNGVQAKESGIELVSLSVLIDGIEYKDQIDISTEELYKTGSWMYLRHHSQILDIYMN